MLDKISGKTPYTSMHNELLEEEKESSPDQQEEVLIAKPQPLQSQNLAINHELSIPPKSSKWRKKSTFGSRDEIKDDLFYADFEKSLNFLLHKRPSSEYNSNPLKKGSLSKHPYSHIGYWEQFKDGMSSEPIEGEP